jgi:hypothetical protein
MTRVLSEEALVSRVKKRHTETLSVNILDGESDSYVRKEVLYSAAGVVRGYKAPIAGTPVTVQGPAELCVPLVEHLPQMHLYIIIKL